MSELNDKIDDALAETLDAPKVTESADGKVENHGILDLVKASIILKNQDRLTKKRITTAKVEFK